MGKEETKGEGPGMSPELAAIAELSGCPLEVVRDTWDEVMNESLWADRGAPLPPVRTEPVLRDPRPLKVTIHGKTYHVHHVVHGQMLGCTSADAQPGTIVPPALFPADGSRHENPSSLSPSQ